MARPSPFRRLRPPVPTLDGRLCLVTGAASGIGRATARAAAEAGAQMLAGTLNSLGVRPDDR